MRSAARSARFVAHLASGIDEERAPAVVVEEQHDHPRYAPDAHHAARRAADDGIGLSTARADDERRGRDVVTGQALVVMIVPRDDELGLRVAERLPQRLAARVVAMWARRKSRVMPDGHGALCLWCPRKLRGQPPRLGRSG